MKLPEDKREQAWLAVFVAMPFALLWPMSELLAEEAAMRVVYGGVLGLLGASIGLGLYAGFGGRPVRVRLLVLLAVVLLGLFVAWSLRR